MEFIGKIIAVLPLESGISAKGFAWKKQTYVMETIEQFPQKVCFDVMGEKTDTYCCNVDDLVKAQLNFNAREYKNRYFNSISAFSVKKLTEVQSN